MNDPHLVLQKIDDMLRESMSSDRAFQLSAFSASAVLIERIREHIQSEEENGINYIDEKLDSLKWHSAAMFELDITNGHDMNTHYCWALGAINTLKKTITRVS